MFLLIVLLLAVVILIFVVYIKNQRAEKKRTVSLIGDDLWKEIDDERQTSIEKGKLFRKILEDKKRGHQR